VGCHLISISIGVGYVRGGFVPISRTSNIARVNFTGKEKKSEVAHKHIYRISQKFIGFVVSLSNKI